MVMSSVIHQHQSATGIHVSPGILNLLPIFLLTLSFCVVPEHRLLGTLLYALNLHWSSISHVVNTVYLYIQVYICTHIYIEFRKVVLTILHQFSSVAQLCPTLCDPMDCSTSSLPVHC